MDDIAWGALALALTLVCGGWAWVSYHRRGLARAVRWSGIALLPVAAYLTHTLRLLGRIATAVGDWATGFVWNPFVWLGLVMAVVGFVLIGVSTRLSGHSVEAGPAGAPKQVRARGGKAGKAPAGADLGLGEDLDDIEAILKKHGIK